MPLPAKLTPADTTRALRRQRLHAQLSASGARGLWLLGGAGSGKSTLAAMWAAEQAAPLHWFRIDAADADWPTALAALGTLAATRRRRLPPLLAHRPAVEALREPQLAGHLQRVLRALHAHLGPTVLVFDDAHAAPTLAPLLEAALAEAPAGTTVVVTSREPPGEAHLDSLLRGHWQVLDSSTLAFTDDEALAWLTPALGHERAAQVAARAGGWAAALGWLARQPQETQLRRQLQRQLSPGEHALLAACALLGDVSEADLAALGQPPEAAALLDAIARRLGLVQAQRQPRRWRLHDLLADALTGDAHAATRRAAAQVLARRGELTRAIACTADGATPLWLQHAPAALHAGRDGDLIRAHALLPPPQGAWVLLRRAQAAWQHGDADAGVWFSQAWDAATHEPAVRLLAAAGMVCLQSRGWRHFTGWSDWVQRLLQAPAQALDVDDSQHVDFAHVIVHLVERAAPLSDPAPLVARVLAALADPARHTTLAVAAAEGLTEWAHYQSDRTLLAQLAAAVPPALSRPGMAGAVAGDWWTTFGWATARLPLPYSPVPQGEAAVAHGVTLALGAGSLGAAFSGLGNLVAGAMARGDLALAASRLAELHALCAEHDGGQPPPARQAMLHLFAARLATLQSRLDTAQAEVDAALALAAAMPPMERWPYTQGAVQVQIARGREDKAIAMANAEGPHHQGMVAVQFDALAALAHCATARRAGQPPPADALAAFMHTAAQHRWLRAANHLPGLLAWVCAEALRQGLEPAFAAELIAERCLPPPDPMLAAWPWPVRVHLTPLAVWVDGQPLPFGARPPRKPLDLLQHIAQRAPAPVATTAVIDALWPEADGDRAQASFDMALLRLRKWLGKDSVLLAAGTLRLNPRSVFVQR